MNKKYRENLVLNIGSIYFKVQIFLLSFLLLFLVLTSPVNANFFINNIFIVFLILASCIIYFLFKNNLKKNNFFLIHISTLFSLFLLNFLLELKSMYFSPDNRVEQFEKKGVVWDKRKHNEVVDDLRKKTGKKNVYRVANPSGFIIGNIAEKINFNLNIVPLSNISDSTIIHCNESGSWRNYKSDKHGFNNPNNIVKNNAKLNLLLLGDSFVEGVCVDEGNDIGSKLRDLNYNVLNLGKFGGGVLAANARFREYKYAYAFKPKFVIYFFYSFNDVADTVSEYKNVFYQKYLNDENFSQKLSTRQNEIDSFWKNFFKLTSKSDFLEKNPSLRIYGQYIDVSPKKLNYKLHLKKMFFLTNIRGFIYNSITSKMFNEEQKLSKEQLKILKKTFTNLKNEVNKIDSKAKLVVVYLPDHSEIINKFFDKNKEINNLMKELDIETINIYDAFTKTDINNLFDFGLSGHFNSQGYKKLAEIIDQHFN